MILKKVVQVMQVVQVLRDLQDKDLKVTIAAGFHLFPFRTEKLSPPAPMVLLIVGE